MELDISGELTWGESIELVDRAVLAAGSESVVGTIEAIDGEVLTVRMCDSLILLAVLGSQPLAAVGKSVVVRPGTLEAWPTGT